MEQVDLKELYPLAVEAVYGAIPEEELPLAEEERVAVTRAVAKRRREFAAGRAFARQALRALGHDVAALTRLDDGQPCWPAGVVGTISHSRGSCGAVVARRRDALGLGLDIESLGRMSERAARHALSPAEMAACLAGELDPQAAWTLRFSAKECVYKCLYPLVRRYIGFGEAEIDLLPQGVLDPRLAAGLLAELPPGGRLVGRYLLTPGQVICGLALLP